MSGAEDRETIRRHKENGTLDAYYESRISGKPAPVIADYITDWPRDPTATMREGSTGWYAARGE